MWLQGAQDPRQGRDEVALGSTAAQKPSGQELEPRTLDQGRSWLAQSHDLLGRKSPGVGAMSEDRAGADADVGSQC